MTTGRIIYNYVVAPIFIAIGTWELSKLFELNHRDKYRTDSEYMRNIWPDEAARYDELIESKETTGLDFDEIHEFRRLTHLLYRPDELVIRDTLTSRMIGATIGVFSYATLAFATGWAPVRSAREFFDK